MGLAGAEDAELNDKMIEYLKKNHSDISQNFFLTADSVISIVSCFDKGFKNIIKLYELYRSYLGAFRNKKYCFFFF